MKKINKFQFNTLWVKKTTLYDQCLLGRYPKLGDQSRISFQMLKFQDLLNMI